jgi:uncharacterized membrane protein YhaH (DUF805 family)/RNA polymerase subunit RPABC4/transcription elongation factor Spt4
MQCGECGRDVPGGKKLCPWCGSVIHGKAEEHRTYVPPAPKASAPQHSAQMYCGDCGKEASKSDHVCPWCGGTRFVKEAKKSVPTAAKTKSPPPAAPASSSPEHRQAYRPMFVEKDDAEKTGVAATAETPPLSRDGSRNCRICGKSIPKYSDACPWCGGTKPLEDKKTDALLAEARATIPDAFQPRREGKFRVFNPNGRLGRVQYLYFSVIAFITNILLLFAQMYLYLFEYGLKLPRHTEFTLLSVTSIVLMLAAILALIINVIATMKRLHDMKKSGLYVLLFILLDIIYQFVYLPRIWKIIFMLAIIAFQVILLLFKGKDEGNGYEKRDGNSFYWQIPLVMLGIPLAVILLCNGIALIL